jgi:hypothetical protein
MSYRFNKDDPVGIMENLWRYDDALEKKHREDYPREEGGLR